VKNKIVIISLFMFGCSFFNGSDAPIQEKYNKAKNKFNNGKYKSAKEDFLYISNSNNPDLWIDSKYYLGLSHFHLEEYDEAISSLMVVINFFEKSNINSMKLNEEEMQIYIDSMFRLCQAKFNNIPSSQYDQSRTKFVIDDLQFYLDNESVYNNSEVKSAIEKMINDLRKKLALKAIDQAKLYIKLEKYEASMLVINDVINQYFDLEISDQAKIVKVYIYLFQEKFEAALKYRKKIKFYNFENYKKIDSLIGNNKQSLTFLEKINFITS